MFGIWIGFSSCSLKGDPFASSSKKYSRVMMHQMPPARSFSYCRTTVLGTSPAPVASAATKIIVPDMDCEVCASKLVAKLNAVAGVAKVEANVKAQTLTITPKEKETPSPKAL
jgi:copper chaperone CopZ